MKKFCVMIQAREDYDYFDKWRTDDTDVYVMTFKEEIDKENYFFFPDSGWTEGRNFLLEKAYDERYQYFIFLDDDARILKKDKTCGIQDFKKLLLEQKPGIGFPDYFWHLNRNGGRFDFGSQLRGSDRFDHPIRYDQCCIAFSQKIVKQILPYESFYDKVNWWISGELNSFKAELMFPQSIMQFNEIVTINLFSDEYPKQGHAAVFNNVKDHFFIKQVIGNPVLQRYPKDRAINSTQQFQPADTPPISKVKIENFFNQDSYIFIENKKFWSGK